MRGLPPAGGSPLIMEGGSKTAHTVISSNSLNTSPTDYQLSGKQSKK